MPRTRTVTFLLTLTIAGAFALAPITVACEAPRVTRVEVLY